MLALVNLSSSTSAGGVMAKTLSNDMYFIYYLCISAPLVVLGITLNSAAISVVNRVAVKLIRHRIFMSLAINDIALIVATNVKQFIDLKFPNNAKNHPINQSTRIIWQTLLIVQCLNLLFLVFDNITSICTSYWHTRFSATKIPLIVTSLLYPFALILAVIAHFSASVTHGPEYVIELFGFAFKLVMLMFLIGLYTAVCIWANANFKGEDWTASSSASNYLGDLRKKLHAVLTTIFLIVSYFCSRGPLLAHLLAGSEEDESGGGFNFVESTSSNIVILFGCVIDPLLYCSLLRDMLLPRLLRFPVLMNTAGISNKTTDNTTNIRTINNKATHVRRQRMTRRLPDMSVSLDGPSSLNGHKKLLPSASPTLSNSSETQSVEI